MASQQFQSQDRVHITNILEWSTQEVCKFFQSQTSKKQLDVTKLIQKHHLTGQDLIEINEQNLIELGIQTIHDRKSILRQVKYIKNQPGSTYGVIRIRLNDCTSSQCFEIKMKVCDVQTKVKHVLRQAYFLMKQKKCDLSQYCLAQGYEHGSRIALANDTSLLQLISTNRIEEFEIQSTSGLIQNLTQPSSISSPIRLIRKNVETSLERLISSPTQTIYVQRIEDNDDVVQLNGSVSELQINNTKQIKRNSSRTAQKQSNVAQAQARKKQSTTQNSNSAASTGRDSTQNNGNYLQNYITSNKMVHKQKTSNMGSGTLNHFQQKKHSVNEAAFNYTGQLQGNFNPVPSTNNNVASGFNSLSRGNSMKKMKTFSGNSNKIQHQPNNIQQYHHGIQLRTNVSSGTKEKGKSTQKGKQMNIYSTMNGETKKSVKKQQQIQKDSDTFSDDYVKIVQEGVFTESTMIDNTPNQVKMHMREHIMQSGLSKASGSYKSSFVQNQPLIASIYNEPKKFNNLNDIFSDFLDEQSNVQSQQQVNTNGKQNPKRAESSHSRQQILLEEDSLESNNKNQNYVQYMQTENQPQLYDPFTTQNHSKGDPLQSLSQLTTQRAVKHMSHKSMYALNSHKGSNQKRQNYVNNQGSQKTAQLYGTFDHTNMSTNTIQHISIHDNQPMKENLNINNCNNIYVNKPLNQRLETEIDQLNKENIATGVDYDVLGKRGGTMHSKPYGRSDSNPTKHRNNRYSENCDDLLMLDMSEDDSILIK